MTSIARPEDSGQAAPRSVAEFDAQHRALLTAKRAARKPRGSAPAADPWHEAGQVALEALEARQRATQLGVLVQAPDDDVTRERAAASADFRARLRARRTPPPADAGTTAATTPDRPLGTTENKVSPAGQTGVAARRTAARAHYSDRRLDRMTLRDLIQDVTTLKSLRGCERNVLQGGVSLRVRDGGRAGFTGLWRCGSVWACPCCSAKVRAERAAELERLAVAWIEAGHGLAMATLTVRHWDRSQLATQLDGVAKSWQKVQAGKWWGGLKAAYGMAGVTRAMEITHGAHGWHTHLHVLVWTDEPMTRETADRMEGELYGKWLAKVTAAGLGQPTREHGVKIDPVRRGQQGAADVAKYVAKIQEADGAERSMGNEMTRGDLKTGRKGSRVPFEIAADHFRTDSADDLALWGEFERATKGRRMLTWSRGLRDMLAALLGEELDERTDEEIAADEELADGVEIAYVPLLPWRKHIAAVPGRRPALIHAAEADGRAGVRALVESWGLVWGVDVLAAAEAGTG